MEELFKNGHYKVMEVSLGSGTSMPLHKATSDAVIIVRQGTAKLIFTDKEIELVQGATFVIPVNKEHRLEVTDKFVACIVLDAGAEIKFA